jgi:sugar phosphate isomerase/epimerase
MGAKYAVVSYLMPFERPKTMDDKKRLADAMNAAGERCKKAGLRFCYHHHSFEFSGPHQDSLIHALIHNTDPKLVSFETDVFWLSSGGEDPVEFIRHHADRIAIVHLKDRPANTPVEFNEGAVKPAAFMEVGSGALNMPGIIEAAAAAGAAYYVVEQDHTPGNPLDSLKKSYDYLRSLKSPALKV